MPEDDRLFGGAIEGYLREFQGELLSVAMTVAIRLLREAGYTDHQIRAELERHLNQSVTDNVKALKTEWRYEPLPDQLRRFREREGLKSDRALSRRLRETDPTGFSHSALGAVSKGEKPSVAMMEQLAAAMDVQCDQFPEYRLHRLRNALDENEMGKATAIENLRLVESDPNLIGRLETQRPQAEIHHSRRDRQPAPKRQK